MNNFRFGLYKQIGMPMHGTIVPVQHMLHSKFRLRLTQRKVPELAQRRPDQ